MKVSGRMPVNSIGLRKHPELALWAGYIARPLYIKVYLIDFIEFSPVAFRWQGVNFLSDR